MEYIFVSMPYAKFDSNWFCNVPNINLGILQAYLTEKGKSVKTFHFHTDFFPHLRKFSSQVHRDFVKLSEQFGVEYLGLDYVFASLLFKDQYIQSRERFQERLASVGLTLDDFEVLREVGRLFIESAFSKLSPYLEGTKLIGFSCSHYQLSSSLLLCSKIKNAYPNILIIVGGKDCSGAFANELLSNIEFIDFVGIGECEITVNSLIEHIDNDEREICNVVFRDAEGAVKKSTLKPNISLNSFPFPKYDFEELLVDPRDVILPIELGRGCPWRGCTFCPDKSYNIRCQSKTAERVKEEIEYYQNISRYFKNFIIIDSDALRDTRMVIDLSKYLEGNDYTFYFATLRAEKIDREVLGALLHFGKWASPFQVGIETFSERVLQVMHKGVSVLKNVEVLKTAAELKAPLQFNLFTCYPKMTQDDLNDNLKVMDSIIHLLVRDNISIYPGEFYLPTDCAVFTECNNYALEKHTESIFSYIFEDFTMPSYSNYPYPYQFNNDEEQFRISQVIRKKSDDFMRKSPRDNFMFFERSPKGLQIVVSHDGQKITHALNTVEKEIYLSAIEISQRIKGISEKLDISIDDIRLILDDFEKKGLILYSSDRESFLSLATESKY